jgi:LPS sulfotransferase NodH
MERTVGEPAWRGAARWLSGLRPSNRRQRAYVRFIILGRSRTGSNYLRGLLGSHPQVLVLGEVLKNPDAIEWGTAPGGSPEAAEVFRREPERFLEDYVFCDRPGYLRAVGFKLFYYHARTGPTSRIWPHLQAMTRLRVIHVKRRNILRTHLSRVRAEQTDVWVNTSGAPESPPPVALDYGTCRRDFEQTRAWEVEADGVFAGHELLEVYYEDLVDEPEIQAQRVQTFLGLPLRGLKPQTYRQGQQSLSASISNYATLKEQFAGTAWQGFFED